MRQSRAIPFSNEALNVEELKFWLRIMQEHAVFIQAGLPQEAGDFIDEATEFQRAFTALGQKTAKLKSVRQSGGFIGEVNEVMIEFIGYQRRLLAAKLDGTLGGGLFPLFLDHMIREADCFGEVLAGAAGKQGNLKHGSHTRAIVVWLRFMADHTNLIGAFLDPTERQMRRRAAEMAALFDDLQLTGRDLASMLYCNKEPVKAFYRFLLEVRQEVQCARDFDKQVEAMIGGRRLLGIMSRELAAHMKRETEHCLLLIALLEKEITKHVPDIFQDDIDNAVWSDDESDALAVRPSDNASGGEGASKPAEPEPVVEPAADVRLEAAVSVPCLPEGPVIAMLDADQLRVPEAEPSQQGESAAKPAARPNDTLLKPGGGKAAPGDMLAMLPLDQHAKPAERKTSVRLPRPLGRR